jgi:hypothetical protein
MRFDLSKYSTVAERLAQFHKDHPDGRIVTEIDSMHGDIGKTRWVIKSTIYLSAADQAAGIAKSTGHAFEIDGTGGANATSALENGESSSIGRALMVAGYAMSKDPNANILASREEMQKVARARDWVEEASRLTDKDALRLLWAEAQAAKASQGVLDKIKEFADVVQPAGSERRRTSGSIPAGDTKKAAK